MIFIKNMFSNFSLNKFIFSNILLFIQILIIVLILPLNTKSFDDSYLQQLLFSFGSINYLKLPLTISFIFIFNLLINFIKNKYIFSFLFLILSLLLFLFLPSHCPLNLCFYSNPNKHNLKNNKFINFFAIGDIQNLHHVHVDKNSSQWHNRIFATELYINSINKFVENIKNNNLDNFQFNLNNKDLFLNIIKEDIQGLINAGDCTQLGNNIGRLTGKNDIGPYEYAFNNNPGDNGLLNIPSFEVLGNHDFDSNNNKSFLDTIKNLLLFEGNPLVNMQIRRNYKRKFLINKDKYGNYALNMADLHIIFTNVWPSKEKLLNGDPTGSLEFLENHLNNNPNNKWILVTHYMPLVNGSFDNSILVDDKQLPYLKDFGKIFNKHKDNCLGTLYGHNHLKNMNHFINDLGLKYYNLPGPAAYLSNTLLKRNSMKIEIPLFTYIKDKKILEKFKIEAEFKNNKYKFYISNYN